MFEEGPSRVKRRVLAETVTSQLTVDVASLSLPKVDVNVLRIKAPGVANPLNGMCMLSLYQFE